MIIHISKKSKHIIKVKKEIISKHENGILISDIMKQYSLVKSRIYIILKKKNRGNEGG